MYTATMEYEFKEDAFEAGCKLWKEDIMDLAKGQPGFVRMQFLTARPRAMAIGNWDSHEDAQNFMQTGVFKNLMTQIEGLIISTPKPQIWELRYFEER